MQGPAVDGNAAPGLPTWVARDPVGLPAYALARAGAAVDALLARHLARVGLRPHTFLVLVHLARDPVLTSADAGRRALIAAGPVLAELGRPAALGLDDTEAATLPALLERVLATVATRSEDEPTSPGEPL